MPSSNVLWIMTDEQQFQPLSCAGHPVVETPNLDRLAERGVRFDRAYCPAPVCGPSRGALFSGRYPSNNGMTSNNTRLDRDVDVLPELLADAGYHTSLVGKLHYTPKAAPHGFEHRRLHDAMYDLYDSEEPWSSAYVAWLAEKRFDGDVTEVIERANADEAAEDSNRFFPGSDWRGEGKHSHDWIADEAVAYLREHREDPVFPFASFFAPHHQHVAPGRWGDLYAPDEVPLPAEYDVSVADRPVGSIVGKDERFAGLDEGGDREILAAYYGLIAHADHCVGRIVDELEAQGRREETLLVFTSDHGDHAGQFGWFTKGTMYANSSVSSGRSITGTAFTKGTMYANSVRVPLIVDDPIEGAGGATTAHVVNNWDCLRRCSTGVASTAPRRVPGASTR